MSDALVIRERFELDAARAELLRETLSRDLTQPEFELFAEYVRRVGLDPFRRQIYALKTRQGMTIHVGIDGLRLIAQRTGLYGGQDGPWWKAQGGPWEEIWESSEPPYAAKVEVYRRGVERPFRGIVRYASYVNPRSDAWQRMGDHMLAKCAEAQALRKAFPAELAGLYVTVDEQGEITSDVPMVNPSGPVTYSQLGELHRLAGELGMGDDERHEAAGVDSFRDLTKARASELIGEWSERGAEEGDPVRGRLEDPPPPRTEEPPEASASGGDLPRAAPEPEEEAPHTPSSGSPAWVRYTEAVEALGGPYRARLVLLPLRRAEQWPWPPAEDWPAERLEQMAEALEVAVVEREE
jgi:phage recombination protein Bet